MIARLNSYFHHHSLLSESQFKFRSQFSTEYVILSLCQQIYYAIDSIISGNRTVWFFWRPSIPFLITLLQKIGYYGVRWPAYKWFKNYASHRQQYITYNNSIISLRQIKPRVPQGSILSPVLFLLYFNDITCCCNALKFLLYAGDTNLYKKRNNLNSIADTLNTELINVLYWIQSNKLTLNPKKTHCLVFC